VSKPTYYIKQTPSKIKPLVHIFSLFLIGIGVLCGIFILLPLLSWEAYLSPVLTNQSFASPIPSSIVLNTVSLRELLKNANDSLQGVDYMDVASWFPANQKLAKQTNPVPIYYLAIPKLGVTHALVSTQDTKLGEHLVHFPGTALPGEKGTTVIFGHSTLPQLFNQNDYKTIFATTYTLKSGDEIDTQIASKKYRYRIFRLQVVSADETSYLTQQADNSYLTLVTCTPPGTTWKRLLIQARIEKI